MLSIIVNYIYDKIIKRSKRGNVYSVPVTSERLGFDEIVEVWAFSPEEAQRRAIDKAYSLSKTGSYKFDKSLGLIQGKEFYTPKSLGQAVTSPIAVWRDPIYKKAVHDVTNNAGYRSGTMLKGAIDELRDVIKTRKTKDGELSLAHLKILAKNNIISIFLWIGVFLVGSIFLYAGVTLPETESKYFNINQPLIAGIVLLVVSFAALTSAIIDYKTIQRKVWGLENDF